MSLHLKYQKIKSKKVKTKKEWITTYEDLCVKMDIDLSKPGPPDEPQQPNFKKNAYIVPCDRQ